MEPLWFGQLPRVLSTRSSATRLLQQLEAQPPDMSACWMQRFLLDIKSSFEKTLGNYLSHRGQFGWEVVFILQFPIVSKAEMLTNCRGGGCSRLG